MSNNPTSNVALVIVVRPADGTRRHDLLEAQNICASFPHRIQVRVAARSGPAGLRTSYLCFAGSYERPSMVGLGTLEDLRTPRLGEARDLVVFRAETLLLQELQRSFEWDWDRSADIDRAGVTEVPALVLPAGDESAARRWQQYEQTTSSAALASTERHTEPDRGTSSESGDAIAPSPGHTISSFLGIPEPDDVLTAVAALYASGQLVTVDKLSRIPPLDAPLDPRLFGDLVELRTGSVQRRVSMRVSVISPSELRKIENLRAGLRALLARFSYTLADGARWMPLDAQLLFRQELDLLDKRGSAALSDIVGADIEKFIAGKRVQLEVDVRRMCEELGRPTSSIPGLLSTVEQQLRERLSRAASGSFLPHVSFTDVSFAPRQKDQASSWAQAATLLHDIAQYARKALTDNRFFLGLHVDEETLLNAMDVVGDWILQQAWNQRARARATEDLELLKSIHHPEVDPRVRCDLILRLMRGEEASMLRSELRKR